MEIFGPEKVLSVQNLWFHTHQSIEAHNDLS